MTDLPQYTKAQLYKENLLPGNILILQITPETWVDFYAGQYLAINFLGTDYFYSIANAPTDSRKIYELHIRVTEGSKKWLEELHKTREIMIHLPYGKCNVDAVNLEKPLVLIAGGTGFAPFNSILDYLATEKKYKSSIEFYLSGRSIEDFYMEEKILYWQEHLNIQYYKWFDVGLKKEKLANFVLQSSKFIEKDANILLAGPFDMAISFRDYFVNHGIKSQNIFSDAFEYII